MSWPPHYHDIYGGYCVATPISGQPPPWATPGYYTSRPWGTLPMSGQSGLVIPLPLNLWHNVHPPSYVPHEPEQPYLEPINSPLHYNVPPPTWETSGPSYYSPPSPLYTPDINVPPNGNQNATPWPGSLPLQSPRRMSRTLRRKSSMHRSSSLVKFKRLRSPIQARLRGTAFDTRISLRGSSELLLDSLNLAPRPAEWRPDYTPSRRTGLSGCVTRSIRAVIDKNTSYSYTLNPLIHYTTSATHPVGYDLRRDPEQADIQFLNVMRPSNELDFLQLATCPAVDELCLWHPRLPWYIHIRASQSNGVTIRDVISQMYEQLSQAIRHREFYNDVLDPSDREIMSTAFFYRCAGDGERLSRGMIRMDFLGFDVIFLGLAKSKDGMWEIKTAEAQP